MKDQQSWEGWVAYTRVSTKDPTQTRAMVNHIQRFAELGFGEGSIYADVASGSKADREGFQTILGLIRTRQVSGVLLARQDRITRGSLDWENILEALRETGIPVRFLDESSLDLSKPDGRFMSRIKAAYGQFFLEELSDKIKVGQERRRQRGEPSRVPFGWTIGEDGKPTLDHRPFCDGLTRAQAARQFVEEILRTRSANRAVAEINAKYGIPQSGRSREERSHQRGKREWIGWYQASYRKWLHNPIHRGHLRYWPGTERERILYHNHPESIMSEVEYEEIQRIIAANKTTRGKGSNRTYPVSGLTRCMSCGGAFTAHGSHRRFELADGTPQKKFYCYYSCQSRASYPDRCPNDQRFSLAEIEMNVQYALRRRADRILSVALTEAEAEGSKATDPEELAIEERLRALRAVPGSMPEISSLIRSLEEQLAGIRRHRGEKQTHGQQIQKDLVSVMQREDFWDGLESTDRKAIYHRFVREIRLGPERQIEIQLLF